MAAEPLFDLKKLKEMHGFKVGALVAVDPELYRKYMTHLSRFVKRDEVAKNLVFLTMLSAYTPDPINLFLRGESSIGKTYNVMQVSRYFPPESVWLLGGLSPTALVHSRGKLVDKEGEEIDLNQKPVKPRKTDYRDAGDYQNALDEYKEQHEIWSRRLEDSHYIVDLKGKILVFLEAPNIETFNMLRPILSHDSWRISYKFTDKTAQGRLRTQHVKIQGWPATIFCTTQEKYVKDLATRCLTITPEMTKEKYKEANILTGTKAAFPWIFSNDNDYEELSSYIRFLKENLETLKVTVPYAEQAAEKFPSVFPRSMRDFDRVLNLMRVSACFHMAQRPVLKRRLKNQEKEETYIIAVKDDFDRVMGLWQRVRETTETSASGSIINFFYTVVSDVAKEHEEFTIADLTDKWNSKFEAKKSSRIIRKWVTFLSDIGYVTSRPDPNDRRRKFFKVIKESEKNTQCGLFDLCIIFELDSLKEWLNKANKIFPLNHVILTEKIYENKQVSAEEVYEKFFSNKESSGGNIQLRPNPPSFTKTAEEIIHKQKRPHYVQFQTFKKLERLTIHIEDKCITCGTEDKMDWQATLHDDTWGLLCGDCGTKLAKKMKETTE